MDLSSIKKNKDFYKESSIVDISNIVEWKKKRGNYNFIALPKTAILTLSSALLERKKRFFSKKIKGIYGKNYILNADFLYCSEFGNGAPAIIVLIEELRVLGVENFIFIGFAGLLKKEFKEKTFIVTNSFSTTGTTSFYSDKDNFKPIHSKWFEFFCAQLNYKETTCWSTDAPFRETKSLVSYYIEKNAQLVDMECASVYALAEFYNINALCILVPADEIVDFVWNEPLNLNELNFVMKGIIKKIISINYAK
jgi:purine-nucleoside phosphorylase